MPQIDLTGSVGSPLDDPNGPGAVSSGNAPESNSLLAPLKDLTNALGDKRRDVSAQPRTPGKPKASMEPEALVSPSTTTATARTEAARRAEMRAAARNGGETRTAARIREKEAQAGLRTKVQAPGENQKLKASFADDPDQGADIAKASG